MPDLGPIHEPVDFAFDAASRLKQQFENAADELEGQLGSRRSAADHAKHDWHGRYVSVFEHSHMSCTISDGRGIAAELRRCAAMIHQLSELAKQEKHRRALACAWEVKHQEWQRQQAHRSFADKLWDGIAGDDEPKPPNLPEQRPQPFVATAPPTRERG
jgi:hypothetical protein